MLHDRDIAEIATRVAAGKVSEAGLERVITTPITDSEGHDALRITLVLKAQAASALTGDAALDLLVQLQQALRGKGEERLPIIEYATEDELKADADEADDEDEREAEADSDPSLTP